MTIAEKYEAIKNQFRQWAREHGTECVWSAAQVAEATGIPTEELFESDNFTGLLTDLSNRGFLCSEVGGERHWSMDCSAWL